MRLDKLGIPRFILIKADEYISAEHVLLALLSDHQSVINAEEKLNTLEKYGQDITDSAENWYLNN